MQALSEPLGVVTRLTAHIEESWGVRQAGRCSAALALARTLLTVVQAAGTLQRI
jgi:hypothetical protein